MAESLSPMVTVAMTSKLSLPLQSHRLVYQDSSAISMKRRSDGNHGCDFVVSHLANLLTACCAITPDTLNSWTWCDIHNFREGQIRCELNSEASQFFYFFFYGWCCPLSWRFSLCMFVHVREERETQSDGVQ